MKKIHVVHHTHWDYEWYFTHNESYIQLIYHLDEVFRALKEDTISYYFLDGQMSIIDSYLQTFPEKKSLIRELVNDNKLTIGPWYTQTDELIIRGESIVRNLDLGIELAKELGGHFKVGYLPDSFGQSKDMPKIYNGFDFKYSIFWRGVSLLDTKYREFKWKSEDGSEVIVSNIKDGYYVGVDLIYSNDYEGLVNTLDNGSTSNQLLLPVGGDQRYVDFNLRSRIDEYNKNLGNNFELFESTYQNYLKCLDSNEFEVLTGEFLSPSVSKIHRSIYSSRYDIKKYNDMVERMMIYIIEPLMIMAEKVGIPYKQGLLDKIWKLINLNQAHDSAGGCNSDKTNRIIIERFKEAHQLIYSLKDYIVRKISESMNASEDNDLFLFNTLPFKVKKTLTIEISTKSRFFELYDSRGELIEYDLIETSKQNNGSITKEIENIDTDKNYFIHKIIIQPILEAMSIHKLKIVEKDKGKNNILASDNNDIENEFYKVYFENDKLCLFNKETQENYIEFITIEDSGDDGDTYDYSPPIIDNKIDLAFNECNVTTEIGNMKQSLKIDGSWELPYGLESRLDYSETKIVDYKLQVILEKETNRIDFKLNINNNVIEHRMRVLFDSKITNEYSYSDTAFGTIKRPVTNPSIKNWKEIGWKEEPTSIYPMLNFVNVHNESRSFTAMTKGIKEYQITGEKYDKIALTLFRSVSYLGKPDLLRRPGKASGNEFKYIETPESQLKQNLGFEFSIQLTKEYSAVSIGNEYLNYSVDPLYFQVQDLNVFTSPIRYFVSNKLPHNTFEIEKLVQLQSDEVLFSSFRKSRGDDSYEFRVFNPDSDNVVQGGKLKFNNDVCYNYVNLKGDSLSKNNLSDTVDLGSFQPGEIKTISIRPE